MFQPSILVELLWVVADISTYQSQHSSTELEKIGTCKSCSYRDPKYPRHQLQCHRIFMHPDAHRNRRGNPREWSWEHSIETSL